MCEEQLEESFGAFHGLRKVATTYLLVHTASLVLGAYDGNAVRCVMQDKMFVKKQMPAKVVALEIDELQTVLLALQGVETTIVDAVVVVAENGEDTVSGLEFGEGWHEGNESVVAKGNEVAGEANHVGILLVDDVYNGIEKLGLVLEAFEMEVGDVDDAIAVEGLGQRAVMIVPLDDFVAPSAKEIAVGVKDYPTDRQYDSCKAETTKGGYPTLCDILADEVAYGPHDERKGKDDEYGNDGKEVIHSYLRFLLHEDGLWLLLHGDDGVLVDEAVHGLIPACRELAVYEFVLYELVTVLEEILGGILLALDIIDGYAVAFGLASYDGFNKVLLVDIEHQTAFVVVVVGVVKGDEDVEVVDGIVFFVDDLCGCVELAIPAITFDVDKERVGRQGVGLGALVALDDGG